MKYKLLVFDLDDTLIGDDLKISDENIAAINKAQAAGVTCMVATGRMHDSAQIIVEKINLNTPIISCQGAIITDTITGELLHECLLPLKFAKQVLKFAEDEGLYAQYYDKLNYYMDKVCDESKLYENLARISGIPLNTRLFDKLNFDPTKILLIADSQIIRKAFNKAKEIWGTNMEIAISKSFYLEFTHPEAHKGNAVKAYAHRLGLTMDQVICIGDGLNDLSMIRMAGLGVSVSNGAEELKITADYITVNQSENAIADVVKRFIL